MVLSHSVQYYYRTERKSSLTQSGSYQLHLPTDVTCRNSGITYNTEPNTTASSSNGLWVRGCASPHRQKTSERHTGSNALKQTLHKNTYSESRVGCLDSAGRQTAERLSGSSSQLKMQTWMPRESPSASSSYTDGTRSPTPTTGSYCRQRRQTRIFLKILPCM